jgi:hypothetical protein
LPCLYFAAKASGRAVSSLRAVRTAQKFPVTSSASFRARTASRRAAAILNLP